VSTIEHRIGGRCTGGAGSSFRGRDPSVPDYMAGLWRQADLPDGVINVVHGDKVAVDAILDHPGMAAVSFVGSTPIARYIHRKAPASGASMHFPMAG